MIVTRLKEITPEFEAAIKPLMGVSFYRMCDSVVNEYAEAWKIEHDDGETSFMVNRFIENELLIIAYAGQCLTTMAAAIIEQAQKSGCEAISFHTKRPALNRLLDKFGFECVGQFYTYEKVLDNGQE